MEKENNSNLSHKNRDKTFVRNVLVVAISNVLTLIVGVLSGFIIPKIMGVEDYGYYKIFTLYISYIGIFHFGFIDGIYLFYAGKNYSELDKEQFKLFTRFIIIFQFISMLIITTISLCFVNSAYGFIFLFVGINLFLCNITTYYQFISQITFRFNELAIINTIRSILNIISILIVYLMYIYIETNLFYKTYIFIYTLINFILLLWYFYRYNDITFGKKISLKENKKFIKTLFKLGFPLLLSNFVGILILNIDRQFVSILFDTYTYGIYAFAYSMLNLVTTAIAAVSTVLYPSLKSKEEDELKMSYNGLVGMIAIIVSLCLFAYFPLEFIVKYFLPQYIKSLDVFKIIFPSLLFNTSVSVVISNYYKSLGDIKKYFHITILVLILSIIANIVAYFILPNPLSISMASVIIMIIWYLISELIIYKKWKISFLNNFLYQIIISIVFYLTAFYIENIYIAAVIYLSTFIIITIIVQRKSCYKLIKREIFH